MLFSQFTSMYDRYETGSETDDFLLNALKLKNSISNFFFQNILSVALHHRMSLASSVSISEVSHDNLAH